MGRDYQIAGEVLVVVKGGAHLISGTVQSGGLGWGVADGRELGLASDSIRLTPRFVHQDIRIDDFGPDIPADVMADLAEVVVRMNLIHYSKNILDVCLRESLGGGRGRWGTLAPAGTLLGGNKFRYADGWHYLSLNLITNDDFPWRFHAAYLAQPPLELPVGTKASVAALTWRCIPYREPPSLFEPMEYVSSGVVLFDHTPDVYVAGG